MIASLLYSFSDFKFHQPLQWVGLKNYLALFQDKYFWISLRNTGYIVGIGVPLILAFSFFLCRPVEHQGARPIYLPRHLLHSRHRADDCQHSALDLGAHRNRVC